MDFINFLGRLHPVVVHLPIGILVIAGAFDVFSYTARFRELRNAVAHTLFVGFVSAVIACAFGYILSLNGSYDEELLSTHRNAGIVLALASGFWWAMASDVFSDIIAFDRRFITVFGVGVVALLGYTGHQGGSLTHGIDYLSFRQEEKQRRVKPLTVADARVFEDVIQPILERRCESCHRRGKRKGDLIVSSYADLMKGGEDGVVIVPGNLANSDLYRRITLDPEHDDFMPTDGRKPLTKEETEAIGWWIGSAQASPDKRVAGIEGHEKMLPVFASILGIEDSTLANEVAASHIRQPNPEIPSLANMAAVEALRTKGIMVRVMLHAPVMLDVTLPAGSHIGMNDLQDNLRLLAKNVVWLNLSGNNLTASDLGILPEMTNLEKLRLERNPIDDQLTDLVKDLRHLEALNINDTKITDVGYAKLKELPSLRRLYRWSSSSGAGK